MTNRLNAFLLVLLCAWPVAAQQQIPPGGGSGGSVNQGTPNSAANAWPVSITFSGTALDPRDISDRSGRQLGQITFASPQHIVCDSGCGSPPATPDNAAFTAGTTNISPVGGVYNDGLANVTSGNQAAPRVTKQRAFHVNIRDANGNEVLPATETTLAAVNTSIQATQPRDITDRAARLLGKVTFNGTQDVFVTNASLAVTFSGGTDVTDRAARLVGVVYGSQGQQLQQSATNYNLFSELRTGGTAYDARSIRALTSSDVVTANAGSGTFAISAASLPLPAGAAADTSVTDTHFTAGTTTAPNKVELVGGKTSDGTPQYQPLPLTNGGAAVKVDGSATTQPVSGTVTANQGGAPWSVSGSGSFTVAQATAANLNATVTGTVTTTPPADASTNVTKFGGTAVATGTGASGTGIPRVTVANDSNILATQSGTWNVTNISGTISLPTNAAQETGGNLATLVTNTTAIAKDSSLTTINATLQATQPRDVTDRAARLLGHITVDAEPSTVAATPTFVGTAMLETTVLAANASRKGFIVVNQSSKVMLLKLGTGIASSSFTVALGPGQSFAVGLAGPLVYTGAVTGIWFGLDGGGALVTEM